MAGLLDRLSAQERRALAALFKAFQRDEPDSVGKMVDAELELPSATLRQKISLSLNEVFVMRMPVDLTRLYGPAALAVDPARAREE